MFCFCFFLKRVTIINNRNYFWWQKTDYLQTVVLSDFHWWHFISRKKMYCMLITLISLMGYKTITFKKVTSELMNSAHQWQHTHKENNKSDHMCGLFYTSTWTLKVTLHEITFTPLVECTKCIQVSSDLWRNDVHSEWWWFEYSGGVIKAFLRLLPTGAPDRGSSLPAAHFSTKTT